MDVIINSRQCPILLDYQEAASMGMGLGSETVALFEDGSIARAGGMHAGVADMAVPIDFDTVDFLKDGIADTVGNVGHCEGVDRLALGAKCHAVPVAEAEEEFEWKSVHETQE
jgi:hypothetical protein